MIVGERKPFDEIKAKVSDYRKVLVLGCGTCVAVCMAGGEKEVELLASQLRLASRMDKKEIEFAEHTIVRQCDREYTEPILEKVREYDAVLSLACGAGVQLVSDMVEDVAVLPALNTRFIGSTREEGVWIERCRSCGDCVLGDTGGICPLTICPKGLVNGPCGGTNDGKCEVTSEKDCAWTTIYNRLDKQGKLDNIRRIFSPIKYSAQTTPGLQVNEAYLKVETEGTDGQ
ncbi:methylenetetrahydrofolate reductase C-terminal domain-containing protein [Dehalococcoidia bacterium]|nr:methylenetetrahydrofolate reductase C-terminal domain-containing protein [Dehalococcoidia bacterium]